MGDAQEDEDGPWRTAILAAISASVGILSMQFLRRVLLCKYRKLSEILIMAEIRSRRQESKHRKNREKTNAAFPVGVIYEYVEHLCQATFWH